MNSFMDGPLLQARNGEIRIITNFDIRSLPTGCAAATQKSFSNFFNAFIISSYLPSTNHQNFIVSWLIGNR